MVSSDGLFDRNLERVIENLPFPVAVDVFDETGDKIVFLNRQFVQTFGYTLEDFGTLAQWAALVYPDEAYRIQVIGQWIQDVDEAFRSNGVVATRELEVLAKDGQVKRVLVNATPVGRAVVAAFVDISQQRQTEAELRSVRHALERTAYELTENIPVGTYTMVQPADGGMAQFRFMSTRFLQLTGLKREEAWADPLKGFACVHPEDFDRWVQLNVEAFATRTRFFGETRLLINGEVRWITAESEPRTLSDGSTVWEGVLTDITTRKLAERALIEAKTRAERLERVKSDFLMQMSHEIRTPLTTIIGIAQLLSMDEMEMGPDHRDKVAQIRQAGQFLLSIVNDTLDISKIEAGQLAIESQPFSLEDVLQQVSALRNTLRDGTVSFDVSAPPEKLPWLIGDARRLCQVLINLTSNAIKFTESGSVRVWVEVRDRTPGHVSLRFNVRDTGIGIDPKILPSLFEPFVQADTGLARKYEGSGLGLPIARQLIELMQGTIGVDSQPGRGSHFWCDLRFDWTPGAAADSQTPAIKVDAVKPRGRLNNRRILVVDDSPSIRALVGDFLQREQASVSFASDGQQAVDKLRRQASVFHAVLMDIQMPVMDGLTATRTLREDLGLVRLPILAMTAGLLAEQQARVRAVGAVKVVPKPIDFEQMVQAILEVTADVPATPFPDIGGIEREDARKNMENDGERFARLLTVFREEFGQIGAQLQTLVQPSRGASSPDARQCSQAAQRLVHSVRGAASQLGARELQRVAERLEAGLLAGAPSTSSLIAELEREIDRLIESIEKKTGAVPVKTQPAP